MGITLDDIMGTLKWAAQNWGTLILTAEMIGAVYFVKVGKLKKGMMMLIMAIITVWIGVIT